MSSTRIIKRKYVIQAIILSILILSTQVFAGSSWFDKGSEFLQSFGIGSQTSQLSIEEIGAGLKEALKVGSKNVVEQLGVTDGFNKDSNIHIPLPPSLDKVKSMLAKVGMSSFFENLELKLNRAAEVATPKAKKLFWNAISKMNFEAVKKIYNGPEDAATQYFQRVMSQDLALEMKPIIENSLSQVGAVMAYDNMMQNYKMIPFVPDVKANLTDHVIKKGMDGIFYYIAQEEIAIRQNPAKRTTELLKKVFTK